VAHPRAFRFGVKVRRASSFEELAAQARRVEDVGWSTLLFSDHFWDVLAPIPAAMAVANATSVLRVGTNVLGNDFRHPVLLAKEAATVDVLSGGRLELGLGAGWMADDYTRAGMAMEPPRMRIERLEEAVAVLRGLFGEGPVDFQGKHYAVRGLEGTPKPRQKNGPPILIGGGGQRLLGVAARWADIVGINPVARSGVHDLETDRDASADATDRKLAWLRRAAGERFAALELSMNVYLAVRTDERGASARLKSERFRLPPELAREVPHGWVGSLEAIRDDLLAWRERWGISYWVLDAAVAGEFAPLVSKLAGT
jgi:probable F420-dependent oxidoreductase